MAATEEHILLMTLLDILFSLQICYQNQQFWLKICNKQAKTKYGMDYFFQLKKINMVTNKKLGQKRNFFVF